MNLSVYEQFQNVHRAKTNKEKIALMQEYAKENAFRTLLDFAFNPGWKWLVPEGTPPYNPAPKEADLQHVLKADWRRLQYFVNTAEGKAIKPLRRETMFIEMLEAMDFNDAKLLVLIKDKKLPFDGITKKLVQQAFPDQTKGW